MALDDIFGDELFRDARLAPYKAGLKRALNTIALRARNPDSFDGVIALGERLTKRLATTPEAAGQRFMQQLSNIIDSGWRARERRYISDLSIILDGLLDIANKPEFDNTALYTSLFAMLQSAQDLTAYQRMVNGACKAAPQLADMKDAPDSHDQIFALLTALHADKTKHPVQLAETIARLPALAKVIIAGRGNVPELTPGLENLLSDGNWKIEFARSLVELPSLQYLPADRVTAYATSQAERDFFKKYIGTAASEDRVRFIDSLNAHLRKLGQDITKLGKPIINTLYEKSRQSGHLSTYWQECAREISYYIDGSRTNKWTRSLAKRIADAQPDSIMQAVIAEYDAQAQAHKLADNRMTYASLIRQVRKSSPIVRGDYTIEDILLNLDDNLLTALDRFDGNKAPLLEAMGSINAVNATYKASGLPATSVIEMFAQGKSHDQIRQTGTSFDEHTKTFLNDLEKNHHIDTLRWLQRQNFAHLDYVRDIHRDSAQAEIFNSAAWRLQDPKTAFDKFTPEQRVRLNFIDSDYIGKALQKVIPEQIEKFATFMPVHLWNTRLSILDLPDQTIDFCKLAEYDEVFAGIDSDGAREIASAILHAPDRRAAVERTTAFVTLEHNGAPPATGQKPYYAQIAKALAHATPTELDVYLKIGGITASHRNQFITWPDLQAIVTKSAKLIDKYGLTDQTESIIAHIKNHYRSRDPTDTSALKDIALSAAKASPTESELMAYIAGIHSTYAFNVSNLQKIKDIPQLEQKTTEIRAIVDNVSTPDLHTILQYAALVSKESLQCIAEMIAKPDRRTPLDKILDIARDHDLAQKASRIQETYRDTFFIFAQATKNLDKFKQLPNTHIYLAAQAYEFARNHKMEEQFFAGLNASLQRGSLEQWARSIIKHFQSSAIGGAQYRRVAV